MSAVEAPTVPWDDVQGNILRAYLFSRARFLCFEITDAAGGVAWLRDTVAPHITAPPPGRRQPPRRAIDLAFSSAGLAALGLPRWMLDAFPADFREGMWARAARLGDLDWERGWCNQPAQDPGDRERLPVGGPDRPVIPHVLVSVHADEPAALDEGEDLVAPGPGVRRVGRMEAAVLEADDEPGDPPSRTRREHFGFADGLSQPRIAGVDKRPDPSRTSLWSRLPWWGSWLRPPVIDPNPVIQLGEFLLGHPDEDGPAPPLPEPEDLFRNGTYLVVRKLGQDVPAFREAMAAAAALRGMDPVDVASAVMGRRPDGEPLVAVPPGRNPRDLSFRDDPDGGACPLGSHIRRANPRDGHALGPAAVNRHRLLRRGLPYGPRYEGDGNAEAERGIVFVSYGASIARQFEFVQRSWLNDGDAVGIGHTADPIGGSPGVPGVVTVPGRGRFVRARPFVIPHGGEYFFVPGLAGLRFLLRSL